MAVSWSRSFLIIALVAIIPAILVLITLMILTAKSYHSTLNDYLLLKLRWLLNLLLRVTLQSTPVIFPLHSKKFSTLFASH